MEIYDWNYSSSNSNFYRSNSNATGVALNKTITANFGMVMDPSTINTNFTLKQGTTVSRCNLQELLLHSNQQTL
jgi:hypothetical protein